MSLMKALTTSVFVLLLMTFFDIIAAKDEHLDHKDGTVKMVMNGMPMPRIPQISQCSPNTKALAVLTTPSDSNVRGVIVFTQNDATEGGVKVTGNITGLPPNTAHAFDIHQNGDLSNGCISAGDHFNPTCAAGRNDHEDNMETMEIGNLGDIVSNREGIVVLNLTNTRISLSGQNTVIGRVVIVHETIHNMATGEAGERVACGIIGIIIAN